MEKLHCKLQYSRIVGNHCIGVLYYHPLQADVNMEEENKQKKIQRSLFLALDKSGSMSGSPIEAVKQGTKIVSSLHKD